MSELGTIGFIGLGNMGWPMAGHLARAGYQVIGFDLDAARAKKFAAEHAAHATEDLGALGRNADVMVTMLPTGKEVRAALLEMQGGALAASLKPGAIVIDMSSADAVGTRALGAELAAKKLILIDAPVSGGTKGAQEATLTIMIGGNDEKALAAAKPILALMGKNLVAVGALGCGHAMKCLNNILAAVNFTAAHEALRTGAAFGLDPKVMIDVINTSTGRSFGTEHSVKQQVLKQPPGGFFALGLMAKDAGIAASLAEQMGTEAVVCRLAADLWAQAREGIGPNEDFTSAANFWAARAGKAAS